MTRTPTRWLAPAGLLASLSLGAPQPQSPGDLVPVVSSIDLLEPVSGTLLGDVDGDGRRDAVLVSGRAVAVHRQREGGSFLQAPDLAFTLPASAIAVDLAVLDPAGRRAELLVARGSRMAHRRLDGEAEFVEMELPALPDPLLPLAGGAAPLPMPLAADLDRSGAPELLVPVARGAAILGLRDGAWRLLGVARASLDVSLDAGDDRPGSSVRQEFALPRIAPFDVTAPDGSVRTLLGISQANEAWVWAVEGDAIRRLQHVRARFRLDEEDRFRAVRGTRRNEEVNDRAVGLQPVDLNGDGIPDFVSSRFRDGEVHLVAGQWGSFAADAPTRTIDADGWVLLAQTKDFDGDGRPDLVVPRLPKIGIGAALRALLSRKVAFDLWLFRNVGGTTLVSETPTWRRTFDFEIVLGGEDGKFNATGRLLILFADVTGDGIVDLATRTDDDRLAIHPGHRESIIAESAVATIPIPKVSEWPEVDLRGEDLDGDGRTDLLLTFGANRKGERNRLLFVVWKPR